MSYGEAVKHRTHHLDTNSTNAQMKLQLTPGNKVEIQTGDKRFPGGIKSETRKSTRDAWDYPNMELFRHI